MTHLVEFFNIKGQDQVTLGSSCSTCSGGCEPVTHDIRETVKDFESKHSDLATITRYELTPDNADLVAKRLQEIYQASDEGLIITASNIKFILSKLSPIVAIDGLLVANNYVPDADELKFAIENKMGIYNNLCH